MQSSRIYVFTGRIAPALGMSYSGRIAILLAASRGNPTAVLKDAATTYKVDTDAIATKVRQEFTAKEKTKKTPQLTSKAVTKAA